MPTHTCPHCQKPFTASSARVLCPHCKQGVELPPTSASRWFYAQAKKKYGPYTWQQLLTLVQRGEVRPDDMLLQEGTKQWVRADTLPSLFAKLPVATTAPAIATRPARRTVPWLIAAVASVGGCALLSVCVLVGSLSLLPNKPTDPPPGNQDKIVEIKKKQEVKDALNKDNDSSKKDDKKTPPEKQPKPLPPDQWVDQFVEQLNRQRKSAGLGSVTLDAELSKGCLAHAKYLARHVDPGKADASNVFEEDPQKPGFSVDGQEAAKNAMIAFAEPLTALERWMGRLSSRISLLNAETQSIGIGSETTEKGDWVCVLDPVRGRGEPIIVYPAPMQTDVPLSFTSGPEVPGLKTSAGYPITVTFPSAKRVTGASIELSEAGSAVEGWTWTPEKPVPSGRQHNSIAFIPRGMLKSSTLYQVKASAQVDGKPWNLAWPFTTDDDSDSKGIWAQKALVKVNAYRAHARLKPVALDEKLSRACLKHARYLVINEGHPALEGLKSHDEDESLPGFSEEGRQAGKASDIGFNAYEPTEGVDSWMATLYHRIPILEPNLTRVGFGCVRGRRQGWVMLLDVNSGLAKGPRSHPVFFPVPDQTGVPLNFPNGGELPNPIPDDKTGRAGYPITAFFPQKVPLQNSMGKLSDAQGAEVLSWFSSKEMPANRNYIPNQGNTVCLIPKAPLLANATYHFHLQGQLAGKAWEKKWTFTTGEGGPKVADATRQVVDRLNYYRTQAGLSAVLLDDKLSFGCQRHAEYLARNAEALLKANAPVNDEDVLLPGFTAEGLRSARQSLVFTNAPIPVMQIDDLMGTFSSRIPLLNPSLQRIGYGCAHDVGRGWRCVLDPNGGRGDGRILVYPAPKQDDVPTTGYDRIDGAKATSGFPITVMFPSRFKLRNVDADFKDQDDKPVEFRLSTPEKPLNAKLQRNTIGLHPLSPLQPGRRYMVTVSAIVDVTEWRQTWQFTTAAR